MLLRMADWEAIRQHFSEAEKATLNAAIDGETICPRGCVVNEDKAGDVAVKVKRLIAESRTR